MFEFCHAPAAAAELLANESLRVEWKDNDADSRKVLRAVTAPANDLENSGKPGYVVLGVSGCDRQSGRSSTS